MIQYFLIDPGNAMPAWCQIVPNKEGGTVWMDFKGRKIELQNGKVLACALGETIDEAQETVPEDIQKLEQDFAYMYLLDPWSNQGWLSPQGKLYGCKYYQHDDIAHALLRKSPEALERAGWVRVHDEIYRRGSWGHGMPRAQIRTLLELGFINPPESIQRDKSFTVDRNAPAPRYAIKPPASVLLNPVLAKRFEPTIDSLLADVKNRLREDETLRALFDLKHEAVPDVGPGSWMWLFHWEDFDIGCPEHPSDILRYDGVYLHKTSFNTLEIEAWPEAGIHFAEGAKELLEGELSQIMRLVA